MEFNLKNVTVEIYDDVQLLPIVKHFQHSQYSILDASAGNTYAEIRQSAQRAISYMKIDDKEKAVLEMSNFLQALTFLENGDNLKARSFAALVRRIGNERFDKGVLLTDNELDRIIQKLSKLEMSQSLMVSILNEVKKKLRIIWISFFQRVKTSKT